VKVEVGSVFDKWVGNVEELIGSVFDIKQLVDNG
jgi:hypothetical protein